MNIHNFLQIEHTYGALKRTFSIARVKRGKNICAVLREPSIMKLVQRSIPVAGEHEVLLKMGTVIISPLDLLLERYGKVGFNLLKTPIILGTTGCGVIIQNKTKSTHIKPGDRVAIDTRLYCGACESCLANLHDNCTMGIMAGTPPKDGLLAQYVKHPAVKCYKLPDHMNMVNGAMCRLIASCIKAYELSQITPETNIAIFGAGITGQSMLVTAKSLGVGNVIMTDRNKRHLKVAQDLGSDYILTHDHVSPSQDISIVCAELLRGAPQVTIDAVGIKESIEEACNAASEYGTMVMMKIPLNVKDIEFKDQQAKQIKILQAEKSAEYFQRALHAITQGAIKIQFLDVVHYPLEKSIEAFDEARRVAYEELKIIAIQCNENLK